MMKSNCTLLYLETIKLLKYVNGIIMIITLYCMHSYVFMNVPT